MADVLAEAGDSFAGRRWPNAGLRLEGISDTSRFNLIGLSEKAGSGFDVLRQAADWAHTEAPSLKETIEPDRVVLTMYVSSKADVGNAGNEADSIAGHDDESMDLTRTERAVLDGMRANPDATSKEIAAEVGISVRQVERARKTLRELGMIKRIGGTRGFWEIRDPGRSSGPPLRRVAQRRAVLSQRPPS